MNASGRGFQAQGTGWSLSRCQRNRHSCALIFSDWVAAIKLMDEVGVNSVKITPAILINAAGGDQGATSLLSTWLAQAVMKGLIDSKKEAQLFPLKRRSKKTSKLF